MLALERYSSRKSSCSFNSVFVFVSGLIRLAPKGMVRWLLQPGAPLLRWDRHYVRTQTPLNRPTILAHVGLSRPLMRRQGNCRFCCWLSSSFEFSNSLDHPLLLFRSQPWE